MIDELTNLLSDEALDFARRHLTKYYDTDFFPKPFEFQAIWYKWDELKKLPRKDLMVKCSPITIPWKKARGGFRIVHQLHPLDAIVYTAMVYSVAKDIENKRREQNSEAVCSYRISLDGTGFFTKGSGFEDYRSRCEYFAGEYKFVLMTDISDFYNQIYLHRLENAISDASNPIKGKIIESYLMSLNTKNSQGIPVGPAASIILSEASLIDVDEFISNQGFNHVRYVDDIRVFANSEYELDGLLQKLTLYLHQSHRLGLVGDKTKIIDSESFLQSELNNQYQLEKLEILDDIESSNNYSGAEYLEEDVEEDVEEEDIGEKLLSAFERIKKYEHLDLGLARAILRRGRAGKHEELIDFVLTNIRQFRPVMNDIVLYLEAVTNTETINSIRKHLRDLLLETQLEDEATKEWICWYIGNHESLSRDSILRVLFENPTRLANIARSVIRTKTISWVRQKKEALLSVGHWDRRAIIHSAQILTKDEKEIWLKSIKQHPSLDILDKWTIDWVLAGTPTSPNLPEPQISWDDFDDSIPFF
ncbi:MAG: RNA-directed DNA polymerase [Methylophilaceae bacterium]